jgi:mRNA interferase MazF
MAITSQPRPGAHLWVENWRSAGLIKPSTVKPVFATIEQALVIRKLGTLDERDQSALRKGIAEALG